MCFIPCVLTKSANSDEVNCGPLSVVMVQGFPSRAKKVVRNLRTVSVVTDEAKPTSGHFSEIVNQCYCKLSQ